MKQSNISRCYWKRVKVDNYGWFLLGCLAGASSAAIGLIVGAYLAGFFTHTTIPLYMPFGPLF